MPHAPAPPPYGGVRRRDALTLLGGLLLSVPRVPAEAPATPLPALPLPENSPLESLGGLLLNCRAIGFGGLSGLHIGDDLAITTVSDLGYWLQARLVLNEVGQPQRLEGLRKGELSDGLVFGLPSKLAHDAESLARLPDGTWLVGFERWQRIRAYDDIGGWGRPAPAPPELRLSPLNKGLESLTILADGRWLAISEGLELQGRDLMRGWVGHPGTWTPFSYAVSSNYRPTDAAALPDGSALVTERSFSILNGGFKGRLMRLPAPLLASPAPGAVLRAEPLLEAEHLPRDNWEGVTAFRWRGRQMVALLTDDNEFFLQQGMLHLFAFKEAG